MYVLGLDIGYSNLKVAAGDKGKGKPTNNFVLPAGAGPVDMLPNHFGGGAADDDYIRLDIDGKKWAVGVEPSKLQGWERELHVDYKSSEVYKALFYAALLQSGQEVVDRVVTGLPVSQANDPEQRRELSEFLKGVHQITPKRQVEVKDVLVVPQPAGAYMDIVSTTEDQALLEAIQHGKTVVLDPGFLTCDYVKLEEGAILDKSSGTSTKAMSRLLQVMDDLIKDDHGGSPGAEIIERALRTNADFVYVFSKRVELAEYVDSAAKEVAKDALTSMRRTMRDEGMRDGGLNADVVLLAGGGATAYREAAESLFNRSRILVAENSVSANARGFWYCG